MIESIKKKLSYCPSSGLFRWAESGDIAGTLNNRGYVRIKFEGKLYSAHTLALRFSGFDDFDFVDHIDGDRSNNKLSNLRVVTSQENMKNKRVQANSKTGVNGVSFKPNGKYRAYIKVDGVLISLGSHSNKWDATCARMSANNKYGFHVNHGR